MRRIAQADIGGEDPLLFQPSADLTITPLAHGV